MAAAAAFFIVALDDLTYFVTVVLQAPRFISQLNLPPPYMRVLSRRARANFHIPSRALDVILCFENYTRVLTFNFHFALAK